MTTSYELVSPYVSALPVSNLQSGRRSLATVIISREVSIAVAPRALLKPVPQQRSSTDASAGIISWTFRRTSTPP